MKRPAGTAAWSLLSVPSRGPVTMLQAIDVTDGRGFATGTHSESHDVHSPVLLTACGL